MTAPNPSEREALATVSGTIKILGRDHDITAALDAIDTLRAALIAPPQQGAEGGCDADGCENHASHEVVIEERVAHHLCNDCYAAPPAPAAGEGLEDKIADYLFKNAAVSEEGAQLHADRILVILTPASERGAADGEGEPDDGEEWPYVEMPPGELLYRLIPEPQVEARVAAAVEAARREERERIRETVRQVIDAAEMEAANLATRMANLLDVIQGHIDEQADIATFTSLIPQIEALVNEHAGVNRPATGGEHG